MKSLRLVVVLIVGFLLGALFHPPQSKADGSSVSVKRANVGGSTMIMGSNVVGFSCVSSGECYIASQ
jgi:hypothetical protein